MSMHLYDRPVFSKLIFFEKGISAMSNLQVNMTKDPIVKSLVIFALPILFSNIFQQSFIALSKITGDNDAQSVSNTKAEAKQQFVD